ncbi:MAG: ferritin family protein [candidate division WOR-3 bacterium]
MRKVCQPILFAIGEEKKALITYLRFAYQTKNPKGKDMFIRLAMDEFEHMEGLSAELISLESKDQWCSYEIPVSEVEDLVPRLSGKEMETEGEKGVDDLTALRVALKLEESAIKFYRGEKEKAEDEIARKFWQRLEEMEIAHYDLIQAEIDNITKTGFWFGIREFTVEGER